MFRLDGKIYFWNISGAGCEKKWVFVKILNDGRFFSRPQLNTTIRSTNGNTRWSNGNIWFSMKSWTTSSRTTFLGPLATQRPITQVCARRGGEWSRGSGGGGGGFAEEFFALAGASPGFYLRGGLVVFCYIYWTTGVRTGGGGSIRNGNDFKNAFFVANEAEMT